MKSKHSLKLSALFMIAYAIHIAINILDFSQYSDFSAWRTIKQVSAILVFLLFALGIMLRKKYSIKTLGIMAIILGIGIISGFYSEKITNLMTIALFILAGTFIDEDEYLNLYWKTAFIMMTIIIVLSYIHPPLDIISYRGSRSGRLYLGFDWVSYSANYLLHIVLAYYTISKNRINWKNTLIIVLLNYILYVATNTRAAFLEVLLYIALLWINRKMPKLGNLRIFNTITIISFPIFAAASIALSYFYNPLNSTMIIIDRLLSGRLSVAKYVINMFGFRLWGSPLDFSGSQITHNADSAFVAILISYGWIVAIFTVLGFTLLCMKANRERNTILSISLFILALHSFSDPQLLNLGFDPFILMLGTLFGRKAFSRHERYNHIAQRHV